MPTNLFNTNFYRASNPDLVSFNDAQAASHFQNYGLNEGRTFSPFVNLNLYRASNSDLASFSNRQVFEHLQNYGVAEGRRFSPFVDFNFYRANNGDLVNLNNEQIFEHLQNYGVAEGRRFSQLVDLNFYRVNNGDLANLNNKQIFEHLQNYGVAEGRRFSPFVDLNIYQAANPDLSAAELDNKQLIEHLASFGVSEGRRFSVSFDSNYYRNTYSDLASARLNNTQLLEHFQRYGLNEGRASSESFNVSYYLTNNGDLGAARFNYQQAQQHFEVYGFREGRRSAALSTLTTGTEPGNTLANSFNLDVLRGSRSFTNFVGSTDRDDYYRFILASSSNVNISLSGISSSNSAKLELIFDSNSNGQVDSGDTLKSVYSYSYYNSAISSPLGAGIYFIRVNAEYNNTNTFYNLSVSAATTATTPKDPGSSLSAALDIGSLSGKRSFSDFIGSADRKDYYRFSLASTSNFNLSLTGLQDSAEAELIYDSNGNNQVDSGETLEYDYGSSYDNGSISSPLGAGTYFLRLSTYYSSSNTNYTLGVSAIPIPSTNPRDPGNTLGTALDIGILSGSRNFRDFVGSADRDDYYRFTLASNSVSNFSLSLSGLDDYAKVQLIYDINSNGQVDNYEVPLEEDYGGSNDNVFISSPLGVGTYFIRVNIYSSAYNTNYTLSLSA